MTVEMAYLLMGGVWLLLCGLCAWDATRADKERERRRGVRS